MENVQEIRKDIKDYEWYKINNYWAVKSFKYNKERILKPRCNQRWYLYVNLCKDWKYKSSIVHRLVMENFIWDSCLTVNHIDGNKFNNNIDNLEYCTARENMQKAQETWLLRRKSWHKSRKLLDEDVLNIRDMRKTWLTWTEIAKKYNVTKGAIYAVCSGKVYSYIK